MSTDNYGPVPPDGSYPAAPPPGPGYPPAPGPEPAQPYGATPENTPGYGQSGPPPAPMPGYGQVPPAYPPAQSYPVPVAPDQYGQYNAGGMGAPVLAEWVIRAKSALIDWGSIYALNIIGTFIRSSAVSALFGLVTLAWAIYNMGYLAGTTGQSYGRKWAGTKLVREDTMQPLGVGLAIGRLIAHFIDSVICWVGYLFPLWTPKKQTIADMVVKSIVVVDQNLK